MKTYLTAAISFIIFACSNPQSESKDSSLMDSIADSSKVNLNIVSPIKDEINDLSNLPDSFMTIKIAGKQRKIFGHRKGDTLIVEGDILINYLPGFQIRSVGTTAQLWPIKANIITVPYLINSGYKYPQRILDGIKLWSHLPIQFISRTTENDYIEFVPGDGTTESYIGRIRNRQVIKLADTALPGNIAHEIGHALGLYHEQSRYDRDKFVQVICTHNSDYYQAFQYDPSSIDMGSYDFYSIMHYRKSDCMNLLVTNLPQGIPGQRNNISAGDSTGILTLYHLH
jgi:hypothetical protein